MIQSQYVFFVIDALHWNLIIVGVLQHISQSGVCDQIAQVRLDDFISDLWIAHLGKFLDNALGDPGNLLRHKEPLIRGLAHQERLPKVHTLEVAVGAEELDKRHGPMKLGGIDL